MKIITGHTGTPHITSEMARAQNIGTFGAEAAILDVGSHFEISFPTATQLKIKSGVLVFGGCAACIDYAEEDTIVIPNGTQGQNRCDLLCAKYERAADSTESVTWINLAGTPTTGAAAPPDVPAGSIYEGDAIAYAPVYRLDISGVATPSATRLLPVRPTGTPELPELPPELPVARKNSGTVAISQVDIYTELARITKNDFLGGKTWPAGKACTVLAFASVSLQQTSSTTVGDFGVRLVFHRTSEQNARTIFSNVQNLKVPSSTPASYPIVGMYTISAADFALASWYITVDAFTKTAGRKHSTTLYTTALK